MIKKQPQVTTIHYTSHEWR